MVQITKTLSSAAKAERIIGHVKGKQPGPTLVFFGGLHGNEPSGVKALKKVFQTLKQNNFKIKGNVYGINGNIPAQLVNKRYLQSDLNRLWTSKNIEKIASKKDTDRNTEEKQLVELYRLLSEILNTESPPYYFIDFHSTSSITLPFITINDALINRRFSRLFPVPIVLGIEEYLEGPLLSYVNEKGYVTIGFESGQHTHVDATKNSIAFIWLTMVFTGFLSRKEVREFDAYHYQLQKSAKGNTNFYEVVHRHPVTSKDSFNMLSGFKSFDPVAKNTPLATYNGEEIKAKKDTVIFMPLYQEQGEEGFFLIRKVPQWALRLSTFLRNIRLDSVIALLPGVSWQNKQNQALMVNPKIARFFRKSFFHLLGYRNRTLDKDHILMTNRERTAKKEMYKDLWWYKKTT